MSKLIAASAIQGAIHAVAKAQACYEEAVGTKGVEHAVAFPGTAYYLPVIYSFTGRKVERLADIKTVLDRCHSLLPPVPSADVWLPYLGDALDAGVATLFAFEIIEACKTLIGPHPVDGIWLGPANDVIMRERGIEFVDGTAPGFAAVVGAAPDAATAVRIARELQEKNLYVFMAGSTHGISFAEQLASKGVQLGWETRLVPFGRDVSACIYALGFANRAALSFGGVAPGDFERNLRYNKNRIFAFVLALGEVDDEKYAAAAGAINYGFPTIANTDIPEILPTGVCTYEHVVSNVPLDRIVDRALEVRGCKVKITKVPIPVAYGPAFEGERIRKADARVEFGGNLSLAFEFVTIADMDEIDDGSIRVVGPEIDEVPEGSALPLAIWVQVAGRKMQLDFEPVLERQIHHLVNGAEGVWHMGQRDIIWTRVSKDAFARGFRLRHYGEIIHAKLLSNYPAIVDKVQVTLITEEDEVRRRVEHARRVYVERNRRLESMTDESVDVFYSCLLCQSFAPNHVCMITPERLGLCGAYNWLDGKAAYEIDGTGPNQPVPKGHCLDPVRGVWEGVNEFVHTHSHRSISTFTAYSIMDHPMTSCGCFESIVAYVPECNGVMIVNREHQGETPVGMTFSTLAGSVGGGVQTPGFMGVGKAFLTSRKFLFAEGGIGRIVWMTRELKNILGEELQKRAEEQGLPGFLEKIADEALSTDPAAIREHLERVGHPALQMPDIATLWADKPIPTGHEDIPEKQQGDSPSIPPPAVKPERRPPATSVIVRFEDEVKLPAIESGDPQRQKEEVTGRAAAPAPTASLPTSAQLETLLAGLKDWIKSELKAEITREVVLNIVQTLQDRFLGGAPSLATGADQVSQAEPKTGTQKESESEPPRPQEPAASLPDRKTEPAGRGSDGSGESPQALVPVVELRPALPSGGPAAASAAQQFAAVTAFRIPAEKPGLSLETVTLGAQRAEGGTRGRSVQLGGQNCMPFYYFEGAAPNAPVLALEVFDSVSPKISPVLREVWGELLLDPPAMAREAVEKYGAQVISVSLAGTHPEKGGKSPEEAEELVKRVLAAVDVPVIVTAHNHFDTANEVLKRVAAGCAGERLLLNWVESNNYRTIAGVALAYGHCVVAQSPIDVNMAKQLNILLTNMDIPRDRIVIDPLAGALGYGLEYSYSVMERIRLTALGGDKLLAFPILANVGLEAWKTKEARVAAADLPGYGELSSRAVLWEVQTAMPLLLAGADLLILHHPESLAVIRRNVNRLTQANGEARSWL